MTDEILRVSSKSVPTSVAGAIVGVVKEEGSAELHVIGAGAANQAIKSVAIARSYLSDTGIDLICVPEFTDVKIDDLDKSAMRLMVYSRNVDEEE